MDKNTTYKSDRFAQNDAREDMKLNFVPKQISQTAAESVWLNLQISSCSRPWWFSHIRENTINTPFALHNKAFDARRRHKSEPQNTAHDLIAGKQTVFIVWNQ